MITLTVNTRELSAAIEPRTHLADFLREGLNLTGTHLGCEHGVCGACTLLLDGVPARSCITYAVACAGARVTTIEGLDDDEIMIELRAAFAREHALQCGYCTPGMLISARDLVLRLPTADEHGIRVGMSGNLCRCTGYVGIIRAIRYVIEARRERGIAPVVGAGRTSLGPAGSGHGLTRPSGEATITSPRSGPSGAPEATMPIADFTPETIIERQFEVRYPPGKVFEFFGDPAAVAACLPGASLTGTPAPERVDGAILVRLGPIAAKFQGAARIERDPTTLSGRIVGIGNDNRSRSSTQGEIRYRLVPLGQGTRVIFSIGYSLRGVLAQFARPGVVSAIAERMTADFAGNLDRALSGLPPDSGQAASSHSLNVFALLGKIVCLRLRRLLLRLRGCRPRNDRESLPADPRERWASLDQAARDAAYDNNAAVADSARWIEQRNRDSVIYRGSHGAKLDLGYADVSQRTAFDLYPSQDNAAPCLIFLHGGYWQRNSREVFACVAEGLAAAGWSVAIAGYSLAPQASLTQIAAEIGVAIDWLVAHGREHGIAGPLVIAGWSAGAQLAALHLGHPGIVAGLAVSGVYELAPLRATGLNKALDLNDEEIETLSPLRLDPVPKPLAIAFGSNELPALVHDSLNLFARREAAGAPGMLLPIAGADHFSILAELQKPDGTLVKAAIELLSRL